MDNWVTIKTFTLPTELAVLRSRLESEGIECFVQNELTAQINPFYSNAIGGVRLQVKEKDLQNAIAILKDGGYAPDVEVQPSGILYKLEEGTLKNLFQKKLPFIRNIILIAFVVCVLVLVIYYATIPSTYEKLTANTWCVDNIEFDGKTYYPSSLGVKIDGSGFCNESMEFQKNNVIDLPGFKTYSITGNWALNDKELKISKIDTFDFVYNGHYEIEFNNNNLILRSDKTTIFCHVQNIHINMPF